MNGLQKTKVYGVISILAGLISIPVCDNDFTVLALTLFIGIPLLLSKKPLEDL